MTISEVEGDFHELPIESDGLPDGWILACLSDVANTRLGKTPRKSDYRDNGIHRIVKFRDITGKGINYSQSKAAYVANNSSALKGLRPLSIGDVLVTASAHSGDQIGKKCACVETLPEVKGGVYFVGELLGITSDSRIMHSKWPYYWFLSENGFKTVQAAVAGVHLTSGRAQNIPIPVAPLDEQNRIIQRLDALLRSLTAAHDHLVKVPLVLKRFRQAVLAAACSGRLTADWREKNLDVELATRLLSRIQQGRKKPKKSHINRAYGEENIYFDIPDSWSFCFFEDICSNKPHGIKAGPFGSSLTKSCYSSSGYKIYGQEQVIRGDVNYGDYYVDEKKFLELKSCEVEARDLLISLVGTIGKVLIIPGRFEKGIINPRLVKVSLHSEISPEYIAKYLSSPLAINIFKRDSHGGTMEILNLKMLKGLPIPLPPVIEQHEIVRRVESMFKLADVVEKRVARATGEAEKLTQAILAKAFRGELVPTEAELARRDGRVYETASELLARIKSQRDAKQVSQKVRRNRS